MVITASISTLSGLWGVLVTDLFQFVLKMGMVIVLAVFAVRSLGGMCGLVAGSSAVDATRRRARLDALVRPRPELGLDAAAHLLRLRRRQLVGVLVSGRRAGRRRIHRPAHLLRQGREALAPGHPLVQPGPLRAAALAVDPRGPGRGRPFQRDPAFAADPESGYIRILIVRPSRSRCAGLMLAAFAAAYMSTIGTQLNWGASYLVNDLYRRFLVRGREREALRPRLAGRDHAPDGPLGRRHLLHGIDRRRLEVPDRHRRGDGPRLHPALVLVADQRLERGLGHGRRAWSPRSSLQFGLRLEGERPAPVRLDRPDHGGRDDGRLAGRDVPDQARAARGAPRLLPAGPARARRSGGPSPARRPTSCPAGTGCST